MDFWTSNNRNLISKQFDDYIIQKFDSNKSTKVPFQLKNKKEPYLMGIKVEVPRDATPGEIIKIDVIKRRKSSCFLKKSETLGGIAIQIRVGK